MNHSLKITGLLSAVALAVGCADGDPEPAQTVTATATETVTATPEAEPESAETEDPWLEGMRDEHLDELFAWWIEYSDADCDASEPECYDLFEAGIEPMYDYAEDYRNTPDRPDYVSALAPNPFIAAERMESWSHACPDAADCVARAENAEEDVLEVLNEAAQWGD